MHVERERERECPCNFILACISLQLWSSWRLKIVGIMFAKYNLEC